MIPLIIANFRLSIADLRDLKYSRFADYQSPRLPIGNRQLAIGNVLLPAERLDFDIDTGWKVQLHQRVDCLRRRIENVHQTLMRSDLKLFARLLVDVRRAQYRPPIFDSG